MWGTGAQLPSQHFVGAPARLVSFATGLIDGRPVSLNGHLDIVPFEADASNARVGILDTRPEAEVSLSMPGFGSVLMLECALVDGEHRLLEPWATSIRPLLSTPMISSDAQGRSAVRRQG